jgi:hypothetical protein
MYLYYTPPKDSEPNLKLVDDNDEVVIVCNKNAPFDSGHMKYGNDMDGLTAYMHEAGAIKRHDVICFVY